MLDLVATQWPSKSEYLTTILVSGRNFLYKLTWSFSFTLFMQGVELYSTQEGKPAHFSNTGLAIPLENSGRL